VSLEDRSFAGPTAVGRYWIAHAEGFAVQSPSGRTLGVVRSVGVDPRTAEPLLVVDRLSLVGGRRRVVPGQRIATVLPWSRRLVLARAARRRSPSRSVPVRAAGRRSVDAGRRTLGTAAAGSRRAVEWTKPHAGAALVAAGRLVRFAALVALSAAARIVRGIAAFAVWLAVVTPPAARAVRAWLVRKRDDWPWRLWLTAPVRVARAIGRRGRTTRLARLRRPVLSGAWARRSRSGA
jgi:hypothetical protein